MKKIRVIGVPEHFNFPWHLAIDEGAFEQRGIEVEWTDIPEGTGRMAKMLAESETDLAIILTEGIVKSIAEGNPSKIIQTYVESPLLWGIHVSANSKYKKLSDLKNTTAAISRFGSGSHLMAFVNAQNQGWSTKDLKFKVVNNLGNAVQSLAKGDADYFMWEHFTTKPLVDNGTFRRIEDCPTPWPCFVIAATEKILNDEPGVIRHILEVINTYSEDFADIPSIHKTIANEYEQKEEDVTNWLSKTYWGQEQLSEELLQHVQKTLATLKLIEEIKPVSFYLASV